MNSFPILNVRDLTKSYPTGAGRLTVLHNISFTLAQGATCSILGPSGSGKTTLLGLAAGLDLPTSGSVLLNGIALAEISEDERARVRNEHVGFVFQNFQLIPTLTALENVTVPMELRGDRSARALALDLLERVGLGGTQRSLSGAAFRRRTTARRPGTRLYQPAESFVCRRADRQPRRGNEPEGDRDHARTEPQRRDRARPRDARSRRRAPDRANDPVAQRRDGRMRSTSRRRSTCHPDPAQRGEGPRNCNPRFLLTRKTLFAWERSLSVLRRIGMTSGGDSAPYASFPRCAARPATLPSFPAWRGATAVRAGGGSCFSPFRFR